MWIRYNILIIRMTLRKMIRLEKNKLYFNITSLLAWVASKQTNKNMNTRNTQFTCTHAQRNLQVFLKRDDLFKIQHHAKQHLQTDMRNELSAQYGRNDGGSWSLAKNVNVTGISYGLEANWGSMYYPREFGVSQFASKC